MSMRLVFVRAPQNALAQLHFGSACRFGCGRAPPPWERQRRGTSGASREIVKPANDSRAYRSVQLDNGLRVLLASDPHADMAAAATTIHAGCFQDPKNRQGLAHFHEHMLFLGTELYPDEDHFSRYLNEHGGDTNAYTASEYTSYYFKVAAPHFQGALHRFGQFFIAPTFDQSCLQREMKAVDSESTNYSMEDSWRMLQVLKTTACPDHPFSQFDVGNLATLNGSCQSELVAWNEEHYQAGAMRLVVLGSEGLDELQELAVKCFGSVRGGEGAKSRPEAAPWPPERLGQIVSVVPVKDSRSISVAWPLPPQSEHLFAKPELYLSHVLGHEGEGSLHDVLTRFGWVDQLLAGPTQAFQQGQLFSLNLTLTESGDARREEVLAVLFAYVELCRQAGPQEATFRELRALQEIAFAHREEAPAVDDFVTQVASALHHYPPGEALRGPYAVDEWRPDVIAQYLDSLQPDRCMIFMASPEFAAVAEQGAGWKRERWYGALHAVEPITAERLEAWRRLVPANSAQMLQLPSPNPFVPTDFSLHGSTNGSRMPILASPPCLLVESPSHRAWHKLDEAFATPRAYVLTHALSPTYALGPDAVVLMRLFCGLLTDDLNAFAYDASLAGLTWSIEFSDALVVTVGGFNGKLLELLSVVARRLQLLLRRLDSEDETLVERLRAQRQILLQDYRNLPKEDPWYLCGYYSSLILIPGWHLSQYETVLKRAPSLAEIAASVRASCERLCLETLIHGNVSEEEARAAAGIVEEAFSGLGRGKAERQWRDVLRPTELPGHLVFEYECGPEQENSGTQNLYLVGELSQDPRRDACLALVCQLAAVSAYQRLRTEQQLGYVVSAGAWAQQHVGGLVVVVQGNHCNPVEVDRRIEAWIEDFAVQLQSLSNQEFENHIEALLSERTQRYSSLSQETMRHWTEIQAQVYHFTRLAESVEALRVISKSDVIAFFQEYLARAAPKRNKLSVRVYGDTDDTRTEGVVLRDLADIRQWQGGAQRFSRPPVFKQSSP